MRRNAGVIIAMLALALMPAGAIAKPRAHRPPEQTGRSAVDGCDALDPSVCMLPFPNDYFTKADATTQTGRLLDFELLGMPRHRAQKPIDPSDWNRADGFSPGSLIVTKIPQIQTQAALDRSGAVPITDIKRTYDPDAPIVVIDADTGRRQLIWTEIDSSVPSGNRTVLIRPAKNLLEGHRYIVALRNLSGDDGKPVAPQAAFKALRDRSADADAGRQAHYEDLFTTLAHAGIDRKELYLAWDFTVASKESLAGRMLAIRDDAFKQLGDTNRKDMKVEGSAPAFTIGQVVDTLCENGVPADQITQGLVGG